MAPTLSDFTYIRNLAKDLAGFSIEDSKDYLIENRLSKLAKDHDFPSSSALIGRIRSEGPQSEYAKLAVEALTINETSFFRDRRIFEAASTSLLSVIHVGGTVALLAFSPIVALLLPRTGQACSRTLKLPSVGRVAQLALVHSFW